MTSIPRQKWIALSLIVMGIVAGSIVGSSLLRAKAQETSALPAPGDGSLPPPTEGLPPPDMQIPPPAVNQQAPPPSAAPDPLPDHPPGISPPSPPESLPPPPPIDSGAQIPPPPTELPPLPPEGMGVEAENSSMENSVKGLGIEGFIYQPEGLRDPFFPLKKVIPLGDEVPEVKADLEFDPKDPLQSFELREYRLVGVLWNVREPKAMVATPDGKIWTIRQKYRLGREGCIVAAIRESEIVIAEPNADGSYVNAATRVITMKK